MQVFNANDLSLQAKAFRARHANVRSLSAYFLYGYPMKSKTTLQQTLKACGVAVALLISHQHANAMDGEKLFKSQCIACHGANGTGNAALQAPPLAGLAADYVTRQLTHFRSQVRGGPPAQGPAATMQAVAMGIPDEAAIKDLARYIGNLKPLPVKANATPMGSSLNTGKALFAVCLACHGSHAQGNTNLGAPGLGQLPPWYITAQLQAYRDGLRGAHPDDKQGQQMQQVIREMELDDDAIRAMSVYIPTLGVKASK